MVNLIKFCEGQKILTVTQISLRTIFKAVIVKKDEKKNFCVSILHGRLTLYFKLGMLVLT